MSSGRRIALGWLAVAATLMAGGCAGFETPRRPSTSGSSPAVVQAAQRSHEVPTPAPPEPAGHPAPASGAAVRAFAARFINWNPATVVRVMRTLARESIGQARSAMTLAAAQVAGTAQIAQNGISNTGAVEAVAPLPGRGNRFVVVTRERTTAALSDAYDGLAPAWHVTVATVSAVPGGGWVVSGWQPEN